LVLVALLDPAARFLPVALNGVVPRPLRPALAERALAALLDAERARELLERFLDAERARERERDLALLDERRFLALRDLPLDDFPLLLAERNRLYTNTDTSRVHEMQNMQD